MEFLNEIFNMKTNVLNANWAAKLTQKSQFHFHFFLYHLSLKQKNAKRYNREYTDKFGDFEKRLIRQEKPAKKDLRKLWKRGTRSNTTTLSMLIRLLVRIANLAFVMENIVIQKRKKHSEFPFLIAEWVKKVLFFQSFTLLFLIMIVLNGYGPFLKVFISYLEGKCKS